MIEHASMTAGRRRKRAAPPLPPSLPSPASLLATGWQILDQQRPEAHVLWNARCWVNGDRKCAFLTFALEADLRMRVYDAASGELLAESPAARSRRRNRPEAKQ